MSSGRCNRLISRTLIAAAALAGVAVSAQQVFADPPARIARIAVVSGQVSFRPSSTDEWDAASPNYPLTIGDHVWTDRSARTELDLGSAAVRLNAQTEMSVLDMDDRSVQLRLTEGTLHVRLRNGWSDSFEVDTPNGAVTLLQPGTYRIDVNANGDASTVTVRRGGASVVAGGFSYRVDAQESMQLDGLDRPHTQLRDAIAIDAFEDWCIARDRREDSALSARYIPEDVVGYSDLDDYGAWANDADYGSVWTPRVAADWVPYREGRWVWIDPWGWTWVDAEPWGFAPFHYGRWVSLRGRWGWVPGRFTARPVYAPALVAFVGGGGWGASLSLGSEPVGWFPLGPREPYVPAYRVSAAYVHAINVPHVNVTTVSVTNITYVNRNVPGAVTAVPRDVFVRSRPVNTAAVAVPRDQARNVQVVGHAAPMGAQAVVRDVRPRVSAPPAAIINRPVVTRRQPPVQLPQQQQQQPQPAPATQAAPRAGAPQQQPQPQRAQPQEQPQRQDQPERQNQPQRQDQPQRQPEQRPARAASRRPPDQKPDQK
ncbi:MAG TPA: DUF6600 domain-containing protein [Vicinamibacterales bacterium]|jgi:hypothetical protein|nr:DUF6600 domain-containing protein [Vicinamibacterales bacterium]